MLSFKTRDLAFGEKELVVHPKNVHFEPTENGRIVFNIENLENDMFEISMLADKQVVSGDHLLYVW